LLEEGPNMTRLAGRLRFPRETEYLLVFWGGFILLWGYALYIQVGEGSLAPGWWVWWSILTFFWLLAPLLGRIMGGYHLNQGLLELKQSIESTPRPS
jgi:hypothetical protein